MYLCTILWLPVHCNIHWKTQMDPMTTLYVPPQYGLIRKDDIQRRDDMCAILIKINNKVFREFPPMILTACTTITHIWMMDPSNMPSQNIKMVPINAGIAKIRSRSVL